MNEKKIVKPEAREIPDTQTEQVAGGFVAEYEEDTAPSTAAPGISINEEEIR